jgi:hypothetical protein
MPATINLGELTGNGKVHNLSGRLRGQAARKMFQIDDIDRRDDAVEVIVPGYVYSLTPSFFQGLFGDSVKAHGNDPSRFLARFRFVAPSIVLEQVERGLSAVLTSRDLKDVR